MDRIATVFTSEQARPEHPSRVHLASYGGHNMSAWIKTKHPGVRYREHKTRLHNGRPDQYFTIYFRINGKLIEEALGWASAGWNISKANLERNKLKQAHMTGEGPQTLAEKREIAHEKREKNRQQKEIEEKEKLTFEKFYAESYSPQNKLNKSSKSVVREDQLSKKFIFPVVGNVTLKNVSAVELEKIKEIMFADEQSARSVRYALAVVRQVLNYARSCKVFAGENPVSHVKMPMADNERKRFLKRHEADALLEKLKEKSVHLYEISLLSLKTGARANEIFSLQWKDVDLENETIVLWDTKNKNSRYVFMTSSIKNMLRDKFETKNSELVFPGRQNIKSTQVSKTFEKTVDELGLNEGISDARQKVVFHTLRHTFASWLAENGTSLYTIKKLMGHKTLAMTERYAHIGDDVMQKALRTLG